MKRFGFCMVTCCLLFASCKDNSPGQNPFYAVGEMVEGQTCGNLIADWANFAIHRPPIDQDPPFCAEAPSGDVWFLAVEPDTGPEERSCTLPDDVSIFFPGIMSFSLSCPEAFGETECAYSTDASLIAYGEAIADEVPEWEVEFHGEHPPDPLEEYFCVGDPFDMDHDPLVESRLSFDASQFAPGVPPFDFDCTAPFEDGNVCGVPAGPRRSVFGGWFFALRPLAPGEYTLHYGGCTTSDPPRCFDNTFYLTVVPRDQL